jgi:hypothetical protein
VLVVTLNYRLQLLGLLPQSALDLLSSRFRMQTCSVEQGSTVLTGTVSDQPQLRALLTVVWDVGGRVDSLGTTPQTPYEIHRTTSESPPRMTRLSRPLQHKPHSPADEASDAPRSKESSHDY